MLNFLNTSVIRTDNGKLVTNWYKKPTYSGRYINSYSIHPYQFKLNTIKNLVDHAILLSDEQFHAQNLSIVKSILKNNSYPGNIVTREIDKRYKFLKINKLKGIRDRKLENQDSKITVMTFPYICNVSEDIKRMIYGRCSVYYSKKAGHNYSER